MAIILISTSGFTGIMYKQNPYIMHKIFTFIAAAAALITTFSCSGNQGTLSVTPENSLEWMSVYEVAATDTATVIKGNLYGREGDEITIPSDIWLKGSASGKRYNLLHEPEDGSTRTAVMPANMTMPFTLVFETLDDNETYADLVCGNERIRKIPVKEVRTAYTTDITGTLVDRPNTSRLILAPANSDSRVQPYISIPVTDGKFSYKLRTDVATAYDIFCWDDYVRGAWMDKTIFSDGGDIDLTIYSYEANKPTEINRCTSEMNKEYRKYTEKEDSMIPGDEMNAWADSLFENGNYFTKEYEHLSDSAHDAGYPQDLINELNAMQESKEAYTDDAKAYLAVCDSIITAKKQRTLDYIRENTGIVSYYLLFNEFFWEEDEELRKEYKDIFETTYAGLYPEHPFTEEITSMIASESIRPGGKFIDFSAPDINGTEHVLSEEIDGKIAVIDLWASWCGPCRRHSKAIIPIYDKYKDKGFTVVGIARENQNTDAMAAAISKDGYKWLNLVELNDAGMIWQKYGAGKSGGMIVLVDRTGTIVSVNPGTDEIREYVEANI